MNEEDWSNEVIISLSEAGEPSINEEPVSNLPKALAKLLKDVGKRKLIVTLKVHSKTSLEKVTQTLEALAKARIINVTFTVGSEENF